MARKVQARNGGYLMVREKGDKALDGAGYPLGQPHTSTIVNRIDKARAKGKKKDYNDLKTLSSIEASFITLRNILEDKDTDASDKISAAKEILNRLIGTPKQSEQTPIQQVENQQINIYLDGRKIDISK